MRMYSKSVKVWLRTDEMVFLRPSLLFRLIVMMLNFIVIEVIVLAGNALQALQNLSYANPVIRLFIASFQEIRLVVIMFKIPPHVKQINAYG